MTHKAIRRYIWRCLGLCQQAHTHRIGRYAWRRTWFGVLLLGLLVTTASAAEDGLFLFVNSRSFDVAVAPVDEESRAADNSILYQRDPSTAEWTALGPCRKITNKSGDVRFTRAVDVTRDGTYYFTSRPVVGGDVENPPLPDDPPQASVVVDTLPPIARIISPEDEYTAKRGETITVKWTAEDEHLTERPVALSYSGDGGKSWNIIERNLKPEGEHDWLIPGDLAGPALLRAAAVDRAGNVGRALRSVEAAAPTPTPPKTVQVKTEPPAPVTAAPEPVTAARETIDPSKHRDPNASWLYYLMALNLMRQNKPEDALQYYWLSVKEDPEFVNAWADIALAYNDLGAYQTARDVVERTRELDPERIDLMHLLGETYHAEGMDLLGRARTAEDRLKAKACIDQAVAWYGKAVDTAAKEWKLAEQAASFYRLGEVCYYVNLDPEGARAYWEKILKLHIPKPNPDLMQWSANRDKAFERRRYERNTDQWVALHTWQNWARGYLDQMNERERKGIVELMRAQRISQARARASRATSLSYAGNAMNPGSEDGRSLFSLPGVLGSPDDLAACAATAGGSGGGVSTKIIGAGVGGMNEINFPAHMNRDALTSGYDFYAPGERQYDSRTGGGASRSGGAGYSRPGLISGREPQRPQVPVDPYAFPSGGQSKARWNEVKPYGNRPIQ